MKFLHYKIAAAMLTLALVHSAFAKNNNWEIITEHQRGYQLGEFIYELSERPTPQCHASTLVEIKDGVMAAWFGGTKEKHPDVGIWISRKTSINAGWSVPVQVADGIENENVRYPCWNPVLFQPNDGPLLLFYKVGPNPREWWGMLITSNDDGHTWSEPRRLPEGILGPIKNKPIQLPNGDILCGTSTEDQGWRVFFQITPDLGETWRTVGPVNNPQKLAAIQPTILRFKKDGHLEALCRSKQGVITKLTSTDDGKSWTKMKKTKLPNPSSGFDGVTLQDGRQLLVYNHTPKGRTPLNLAITKHGKRWSQVLLLEDEPGEYSYPAIIQTSDGLVHISYTWKRETIKYVIVDPSKF